MPSRATLWGIAFGLCIVALGVLWNVPLWGMWLCAAIAGWRVSVWTRRR